MLIAYKGKVPQVDASAYVQHSAQVVGDVHLGRHASVWFNTVIRADVHYIRIGDRTNVQDNSTIHVTAARWPTIIGAEVTIGHGVILHGCTVDDRCLIGVGAIVLDGCEIGSDCLIAAGSLVTPRTTIAPGQLVLGRPANAVRALTSAELDSLRQSAANYVAHAESYLAQEAESVSR